MVNRTIQRDAGRKKATKGIGEECAAQIEDCHVAEPGRACARGWATQTFLGVQPNVVMIATG